MNSRCLRTLIIFATTIAACSAGTILIGGDDLHDHGSYNQTHGVMQGWKYLSLVIPILRQDSTLSERDGTVVLLGAAETPLIEFDGGGADFDNDAYEAYYRALQSVDLLDTLRTINGADDIRWFLQSLNDDTEKPSVLVLLGDEAGNDFDDEEEDVINANGEVFQQYARRGGSLLSHASDNASAYGWLRDVTNIRVTDSCNSTGAMMTDIARTLFPTLENSDIDRNAGPCHNHFTAGDGGADISFSAFQPLALDANSLVFMMISRGTIGERSVIRMNCSAETIQEGTFTVRLPILNGGGFHFSLNFQADAGTTGPAFEQLLVSTLTAHAPYTNQDTGLDCTASRPGVFQASCPGTLNLRDLEICFGGSCANVDSMFALNGLRCPEPPCPTCEGVPEEPVCDQSVRVYHSECEFDQIACEFPGQELMISPCPSPAPTASPTPSPTRTPTVADGEVGVVDPDPEASVSVSGGIGGTAFTLGGLIGVILAALCCIFLCVFFAWNRKKMSRSSPVVDVEAGEAYS